MYEELIQNFITSTNREERLEFSKQIVRLISPEEAYAIDSNLPALVCMNGTSYMEYEYSIFLKSKSFNTKAIQAISNIQGWKRINFTNKEALALYAELASNGAYSKYLTTRVTGIKCAESFVNATDFTDFISQIQRMNQLFGIGEGAMSDFVRVSDFDEGLRVKTNIGNFENQGGLVLVLYMNEQEVCTVGGYLRDPLYINQIQNKRDTGDLRHSIHQEYGINPLALLTLSMYALSERRFTKIRTLPEQMKCTHYSKNTRPYEQVARNFELEKINGFYWLGPTQVHNKLIKTRYSSRVNQILKDIKTD